MEARDTCDGERKQVSPASKIKAQVELEERWATCTHFRLYILRFGTGGVAPLHRLLQFLLLAAGGRTPAVGHRADSRGRCSNKEGEVCVRRLCQEDRKCSCLRPGGPWNHCRGGCAEE